MSKYINIVLLSIFGPLSIKYRMGLSLYIPFVCYYSFKNIKNMFLIIPLSFVSVYYFKINIYILLGALYIGIILLSYIKKNKKIIFTLFTLVSSTVIYFILKETNVSIFYNLFICFISTIIFLFLIYNNDTPRDINKRIRSIAYNEVILAIILTLGVGHYKIVNIPISLILSIYFVMYLSSNRYIFSSIFYGFIMMISLKYFYNVEEALLIPIVSFIYMIPNLFSSVVLFLFLIYIYYFEKEMIDKTLIYQLLIEEMIFEMLRHFIVNKDESIEILNNTYERIISQVDYELESFSLFLDKVSKNLSSNEYHEELGFAIEKLAKNVCDNCVNKIECYKKNKGKIYYFLKNNILGISNDFICVKKEEMKRQGRSLKYNLTNKSAYINDVLFPILNSVSNILRQYKIDHSLNVELDYNLLNNIKEGLEDYGYSLSLFNVVKTFKNNYIIEVGIIGICFNEEKDHIEHIVSHYIKNPSMITIKKICRNKTYITITPKINYEIIYGYGSLSKIGNNICGDNYLVKTINQNKIIAAICDGMGKGLNANILSTRTINLLDEITNTNITGETSLQILNALYYIQEYQEKYSTIDYLEIDKQTGELTLYKAGAAFTYIVHNDGQLEKIENENLPFGLNEVVITSKYQLNNKDLIIMASDGIFENVINEEEFEKFIKDIRNLEPQKISYEILNYARHTDLISKDDMSVIALKVITI